MGSSHGRLVVGSQSLRYNQHIAPQELIHGATKSVSVQQSNVDSFREFMRQVPSALAVITVLEANGSPRGMCASSFQSLSLKPSLIYFNLMLHNRMHRTLETASVFAVHLLSETQKDLCGRFAKPRLSSDEQFLGISYATDPETKLPILQDCLGVLICSKHSITQPLGDHVIVVGAVDRTIINNSSGEPKPLIWFSQGYRTLS
mmetsp:Transcript_27981/g.45408  ORF Transcript_27981/g.45408 Transcript_27981/m.45408 type:complete len:203 (+) Transcript_27981:151-759(+)